jgi:hypothetical protein
VGSAGGASRRALVGRGGARRGEEGGRDRRSRAASLVKAARARKRRVVLGAPGVEKRAHLGFRGRATCPGDCPRRSRSNHPPPRRQTPDPTGHFCPGLHPPRDNARLWGTFLGAAAPRSTDFSLLGPATPGRIASNDFARFKVRAGRHARCIVHDRQTSLAASTRSPTPLGLEDIQGARGRQRDRKQPCGSSG